MRKPFPVNDWNFDIEVLESDTPVLVDFWAEGCGLCEVVSPIMDQIAQAYGDRLTVVTINVDENLRTGIRFNIQSIPTLMLFKDGKIVERLAGPPIKRNLLESIHFYLS